MVYTCCVPNCRGNYDEDNKVSIFKFPKDEGLKKAWLSKISRKDFTPTSCSRVCEKHFRLEDVRREASGFDDRTGKYITAPLSNPVLVKDAVPCKFPKDEEIRKLWEVGVNRKNFKATKSSRLCSKHFTEECFDRKKLGGITWLKRDAVPTIFNSPGKKTGPTKRKCFVGDFSDADMNSPTKAKKLLRLAKEQIKQKNHTIKNISQKNNILEKRIASLEGILKSMQKEALITDSASSVLEKSDADIQQPSTSQDATLIFITLPAATKSEQNQKCITPDLPLEHSEAGPSSQSYPGSSENVCNEIKKEPLSESEEDSDYNSSNRESLFQPIGLIKEELITVEEDMSIKEKF